MSVNRKRTKGNNQMSARTNSTVESLEPRQLMAVTTGIPIPTTVAVTTVSQSELSVHWTDNSSDESRFILQRAKGTGRFVPIASLPAGATSFVDSGLLPLTKYRYRVQAATDLAESRWARPAMGATASWLTANPTSAAQVDLNWTDVISGEKQFLVERAGTRGGFKRLAAVPADTTTYSDVSVTSESAYRYRVRAVGGGPKLLAATANATTPAPQSVVIPQPPVAPSALTVTATFPSRIDLTWSDNSADETGFALDRSVDGGATWTALAVVGPSVTS